MHVRAVQAGSEEQSGSAQSTSWSSSSSRSLLHSSTGRLAKALSRMYSEPSWPAERALKMSSQSPGVNMLQLAKRW